MDAVVVGSGPNGLAAAVALARAGASVRVHEAEAQIGGGTRSAELTLPGFVHDVCSAVHPMAAASPFFREIGLDVEWIHPDLPCAHPLDDGTAVALARSVDETARSLRQDGDAYRRIVEPLAHRFDDLVRDTFGPLLRVPRHPLLLAQFGLRAVLSLDRLARDAFSGERARALFAGLGAHSILPLDTPFTGSFGLIFAASAHAVGWPIARRGSQRIADALAAALRENGGEIVVGHRVERIEELDGARAILFDTSPPILERVARDRLPASYRERLRRLRPGPGVFKIDYALSEPAPWMARECREAGTVHVGGTLDAIAAAEALVARGGHPDEPFVLVSQQSLFDATLAPAGKHTFWAYCHVPNGSTVDMTSRIEAQIERFAPGFRDVVLARHVTTPRDLEARNASCTGGDIGGGVSGALGLVARPFPSLDPYATPAEGIFLCSSSTPPGGGVHGMCGANAAASALRRLF